MRGARRDSFPDCGESTPLSHAPAQGVADRRPPRTGASCRDTGGGSASVGQSQNSLHVVDLVGGDAQRLQLLVIAGEDLLAQA